MPTFNERPCVRTLPACQVGIEPWKHSCPLLKTSTLEACVPRQATAKPLHYQTSQYAPKVRTPTSSTPSLTLRLCVIIIAQPVAENCVLASNPKTVLHFTEVVDL